MSLSAPRWTLEQFQQGVTKGIEVFRDQRLNEAREDYSSHFNEARNAIEDVLELSTDLTTLETTGWKVVSNAAYMEALRYIAGPPISTDDLVTVSEVRQGEWVAANLWPTVVSTVLALVDGHRFPWLAAAREPTEAER